MINQQHGSRILKLTLGICLSLQAVSCGTILYPERRGQPAGQLDFKVVALDAVGLLAFFVPGVIAFAVDFNNGTIYLPPEDYSELSGGPTSQKNWTTIEVDAEKLNKEKLVSIIQQRTGKTISLQPGTFQVRQLEHTEQIATLLTSEPHCPVAGSPNAVLFRCQSE